MGTMTFSEQLGKLCELFTFDHMITNLVDNVVNGKYGVLVILNFECFMMGFGDKQQKFEKFMNDAGIYSIRDACVGDFASKFPSNNSYVVSFQVGGTASEWKDVTIAVLNQEESWEKGFEAVAFETTEQNAIDDILRLKDLLLVERVLTM